MNKLLFILPLIFFFPTVVSALTISDSLLIEGYYTQQGKSIPRNQLENFLLEQNPSALLADQAKGFSLSSWAVGTPLWCVNTGITVYEIENFIDAIKKQEIISSSINSFAVPLFIGSDVTLFVQNILRNRSDYALHRAVVAYNNEIMEKHGPDSLMNHCIKKTNSGWYMQDRVLMPGSVLIPVLKENVASRPLAYWSSATGLLANQAISIGVMFLAFAAIGYIEEQSMSIDTRKRNLEMSLGISLTGFGIINAIIADVTRNTAIKKYNDSIK